MTKRGSLFVVDDNPNILKAVRMLMEDDFKRIITLSSPASLPSLLKEERPDVMLLDMNFSAGINSGAEGLHWLGEVKRLSPQTEVVLFTAYADIDLAVQGIKNGAADFIVKPWENDRMVATLTSARDNGETSAQGSHPSPITSKSSSPTPNSSSMYWGESDAMNSLRRIVEKVATTDANILITGENGTGKEVLAQSIHNHSLRAENPFVAVNCASITESLLESELFGYDEGAFTGAKKGGKPGYFEMAHTGTIFLDEISELSLPMQSKLLRAIQEKQIIHVGGNRVIHFDTRIIAAANRDLWKMACEHQFREDLYYRLAVLELNIPALKDRQEDILPLFFKFMFHLNPELSSRFQTHTPRLEALLCSYSWPGNIRELENFAHMISVTAGATDSSETLMTVITTEIYRRIARTETVPAAAAVPLPEASHPVQAGDLLSERERVRYALSQANGNCTQAAQLLNISRTTLWRKMKAMGLSAEKESD